MCIYIYLDISRKTGDIDEIIDLYIDLELNNIHKYIIYTYFIYISNIHIYIYTIDIFHYYYY